MRISLVVRNGVLGQEAIAAFRYYDDADEFCAASDDNYDTVSASSDLSIISLVVDLHLGGSIEDVGDPQITEDSFDDDD